MHNTSKQLKLYSRQILKGKYKVVITALLLLVGVSILINIPFLIVMPREITIMSQVLAFLTDFIISLLIMLLTAGYLKFMLKLTRGEETQNTDIFYCYKNKPDRYLIPAIFFGLITIVLNIPHTLFQLFARPLFTSYIRFYIWSLIIGLITSIFVILANLILCIIYMEMLDNLQISPKRAIAQGIILIKGHTRELFYLILSFFGVSVLGVLSLYIGFLWIYPYMMETLIQFYFNIKQGNC